MREGEALRQLKHSNAVQMVAAVEEEVPTTGAVVHYLVMEYVAGGSLWDLLDEQKTLPHVRAVEISLELADALARAHHLGVIHRDLKPADVLLAQIGGRQRLLMLGARPLLLPENGASAASDELAVLAIDLDGASLARIFTAGSREFVPGPASAVVIDDDRILVSFDDRLVMLDVGLALEAVSQATSSQ